MPPFARGNGLPASSQACTGRGFLSLGVSALSAISISSSGRTMRPAAPRGCEED